ncbi:Uncharacterised protein [Catenibacterium mitsuokai]|nr:Uncharacterised protein [Catenibacterium mitsuokai]
MRAEQSRAEQSRAEQSRAEQTGFPSIDKPWLKYYNKEAIHTKPFSGSIYRHILQNNQEYQDNCALQYFGRCKRRR